MGDDRRMRSTVIGVVGAVLIILGALLPWVVDDSMFETGVPGIIGEGRITLVFGALALLLVVWAHIRPSTWAAIATLVLAAIVTVMMVREINDILTTTDSGPIGVGIHVSLLGAIIMLLGGAFRLAGWVMGRSPYTQ